MSESEKMNGFLRIARERYSCRNYIQRPVPEDLLYVILEAARLAPSACNRQPWLFIVVNTPGLAAEIRAAYPRDWMNNAGTFIVACGDHSRSWHREDGKDHCDIDLAIAVEHICLAASDLGLGTCWICNFDAERLANVLGLPEHIEPEAIIPVGYPDTGSFAPAKNRKTIEDIVIWGKYRQ